MKVITYVIDKNIYINLTNQCSNSCDFCIRNDNDGINGYTLWLESEPTAAEIIAELEQLDTTKYNEVVFCGFGEPMYRYEIIKEVANYVHSKGGTTRMNTNGQGCAILGYDVTENFGDYIDVVSISLNATNASEYQNICRSIYGEGAFDIMLDFARKLVGKCKRVVFSVVDCIGQEEIDKSRLIAQSVGVELRIRELI